MNVIVMKKEPRKTMKKILTLIICLVVLFTAASCGNKDTNTQTGAGEKTPSADVILQIQNESGNQMVQMSLDDIKKLGTVTLQYSGRSKEQNNKRDIEEYTGVPLEKLLEKEGFNDVKVIRVVCSDGYTKEYELDKLNSLYAFKNDSDTKGTKVESMLAIVDNKELTSKDSQFDPADGTPLRLVFGQESYDTKETKDFNMQGWASFVETIVVEE